MSKRLNLIPPTPEEDAAINIGIAQDPDTYEISEHEFAEMRPLRGRPKSVNPKININIRLSPDVLDAFKATGPRWQTRIDEALRIYLKDHKAV